MGTNITSIRSRGTLDPPDIQNDIIIIVISVITFAHSRGSIGWEGERGLSQDLQILLGVARHTCGVEHLTRTSHSKEILPSR